MNLKNELELRLEKVQNSIDYTQKRLIQAKEDKNERAISFQDGRRAALYDEYLFLTGLIEGVLISEC